MWITSLSLKHATLFAYTSVHSNLPLFMSFSVLAWWSAGVWCFATSTFFLISTMITLWLISGIYPLINVLKWHMKVLAFGVFMCLWVWKGEWETARGFVFQSSASLSVVFSLWCRPNTVITLVGLQPSGVSSQHAIHMMYCQAGTVFFF